MKPASKCKTAYVIKPIFPCAQGSGARERELSAALAECDSRLASAVSSAVFAEERAVSAEDAVGRAANDAAQLRSRLATLEAGGKAGQKEVARLKVGLLQRFS